jgi:hypothetical protein
MDHDELRALAAGVRNGGVLAYDAPGRKLLLNAARLDNLEADPPPPRRLAETAAELRGLREMADDPAGVVRGDFSASCPDPSDVERSVCAVMLGRDGGARTIEAACAIAKGRAQAAMRGGNVEPYAGPAALAGDALTKQIHRVVLGDLAYSNGGGK